MKSTLTLALLFTLALTGPALARGGQGRCPDVRASEVAARTDDQGHNQCTIGITLFGYTFGIDMGQCPLFSFAYPAHQECLGVHNEGTECTPGEDVEVRLLKCSCNYFGGRSFGLSLPGCDCVDTGNAGWVEDFKTTVCVPFPSSFSQ